MSTAAPRPGPSAPGRCEVSSGRPARGSGPASRAASISLLSVNDLHGTLAGGDQTYADPYSGVAAPAGGAAVLAWHLRRRAAAGRRATVLVHTGDMIGGSPPESGLLRDEPTIRVLNELEFAVGTPGNHELDGGVGQLLRLLRGGRRRGPAGAFPGQRFPLVSANVVDRRSGRPVFMPFKRVVADGVSIGFVGATTILTPSLMQERASAGLAFLDEAAAVNRWARFLRRRGVGVVVLLLHEGGTQSAFPDGLVSPRVGEIAAALDPGVDVILAGHTHAVLNARVQGRLVVQASAFGRAFAEVTLTVDRLTGRLTSSAAEIVPAWRFDPPGSRNPVPRDAAVQRIVDDATEATVSLVGQIVSRAGREVPAARDGGASPAGESPLGDLVADAQRWATGARLAFVNPSSLRASIGAGQVAWGDLFRVQPFRNDLVTMELTGAQVWTLLRQQFKTGHARFNRILEVSGLHYRYRSERLGEGEILAVHEGAPGDEARPIPDDASRTYTVTVNAFLAAGGDDFPVLRDGRKRRQGSGELDALVAYVRCLPVPFDYRVEGRIALLP